MAITWPTGETVRVNRVLTTRERNYYDDSDFYALVYDDEHDSIVEIIYDTTRFTCGGDAHADAPPEIHEKAKAAWVRDHFEQLKQEYEIDSKNPRYEGRRVRVVKGRKNPKGTEGVVQRIKTYKSKFDSGKYSVLGIDPGNGAEWVWDYDRNVEVVDPVVPSDEEILDQLRRLANIGAYLRPNYRPGVVVV